MNKEDTDVTKRVQLLCEMEVLAERLEYEKRFSRLAEQDDRMRELWEKYCEIAYK